MLVSAIMTEVLYDLRDRNGTNYNEDGEYAELIGYLNRSVRALNANLVSLGSDLVHATDEDTTLAEDDNSVTVPDDFITVRSIWISTTRLAKITVDDLYYKRKYSDDGEPSYFAVEGTNFQFEKTADDDYDLIIHYNQKQDALTTSSSMPYNDIFNDAISQAIVVQAKTRNEQGANVNALLQSIFQSAATSYVIARNYSPTIQRANF